jgi:hypothetical protein
MTRISRLSLVLVTLSILVLTSAPLASARPMATSQVVERTVDGWFGAAVRWLDDLVGGHHSTTRAAGSPESAQKDGKLPGPTGSSCLDPTGHPKPWCL